MRALTAVGLFAAMVVGFWVTYGARGSVALAFYEPISQSEWTVYRHPIGVSFRHPRYLRPVSVDVNVFHIEGLVAAIDLVTEDSRVVLRFMVSEPGDNPLAVNFDRAFLRKVCKTYRSLKIGKADAVNCVTCGRGACHWAVHVLGRRQVQIFTSLADESDQPGPRDGTFPLLSIIRSLDVAGR
jgi:hypothetical protein